MFANPVFINPGRYSKDLMSLKFHLIYGNSVNMNLCRKIPLSALVTEPFL